LSQAIPIHSDTADAAALARTIPFLWTQEAMKMMKDRKPKGGCIINNGAHPRPFLVAYTSHKHAITGFAKST
jgi:NAD(P)-dependent dehydrogenase (short-subunit alcohol dehydrogenase family)